MVAKTKRTPEPTAAVDFAAGASKDVMDKFMKASTEGYEKAFASAQDRMQEMMKQYDDLAGMGQKAMQAFVASGTAYAKGYETLSAELMAFSKQQVEDSAAAARAAMTAKSLQELIDLQTSYAKTSLDAMMSESSKLSEITTKLAQDTVEPLNEQFTATFDTMAGKIKAA